jgi:nickel superoxide dismutase
MIGELSADPAKNMNQLVRWVNNKEVHADNVREVVSQYFLAQRIKEPAAGNMVAEKAYHAKLALLHQMIRTAMKCKQTTDTANATKLHDLTHAFQELYQAK